MNESDYQPPLDLQENPGHRFHRPYPGGHVRNGVGRNQAHNTGQHREKEVTLAKDTIRFTIDDENIDGTLVGQRPEERIGKAYRRS